MRSSLAGRPNAWPTPGPRTSKRALSGRRNATSIVIASLWFWSIRIVVARNEVEVRFEYFSAVLCRIATTSGACALSTALRNPSSRTSEKRTLFGPVFLKRSLIQINTQARLLRDIQITILGSQLLSGDRLAQIGLLFRYELADQRVGNRVQPMQSGRHVHIGREAMIGDGQSTVPGQRGDLHRFRKASAAREVDLRHVDASAIHQLDERLPVALLFARRDAHVRRFGQFSVAVVVVGTQRLFEPEDVVVGKGAGTLQGGLGIPNQACVDQQVGIVAEAFAAF